MNTISTNINEAETAVIILNYFGADDTIKCVNSVLHFEAMRVIVIDNSASCSEEEKLNSALLELDLVTMISPGKNLGFAAGVNVGLRYAIDQGIKRYLLLNNDAELIPEKPCFWRLQYSKYTNTVFSPVIKWGHELVGLQYYHSWFGLIHHSPMKILPGWVPFYTGCVLAFDKEALDRIGLLDESIFMYGEDIAFSFLAVKRGVKLQLLDQILVTHAGSKSASVGSFFYEYHTAHGHLSLCSIMWENPLARMVVYCMKYMVLLIRAIIRSIRMRTSIPLKALLYAPFKWPIRPE